MMRIPMTWRSSQRNDDGYDDLVCEDDIHRAP